MSKLTLAAVLLVVTLAATTNAASIYVTIPNVLGNNPIPGSPNAILADSLEVDANDFIVTKPVDKASPKIEQDVATGIPLSPVTISVFNAAPTQTPDLQLSFSSVIASARTTFGGSGPTMVEEDTFSTPQESSLYLELPGIMGGSKRGAYPDLIALQSFTLDESGLTIVKDLDTSSPQLAAAAADGKVFSTASILVYDSNDPAAQPSSAIVFDDVAASSFAPSVSQGLSETDGFQFGTIAAVPEPSTCAALLGILLTLVMRRVNSRDRDGLVESRRN